MRGDTQDGNRKDVRIKPSGNSKRFGSLPDAGLRQKNYRTIAAFSPTYGLYRAHPAAALRNHFQLGLATIRRIPPESNQVYAGIPQRAQHACAFANPVWDRGGIVLHFRDRFVYWASLIFSYPRMPTPVEKSAQAPTPSEAVKKWVGRR